MANADPNAVVSSERCTGTTQSADLALPIAQSGAPRTKIKKSANGPRRAAVLIGVHVLILLHVAHYLYAGTTVSPLEPSESMYALELGQINAGVILFALALLSTVVFGRFFCGWGCHVVAYQDLCAWFLKKIGIKPRPFRSRLLIFVPLGLALYMFVFPSAKRFLFPTPQNRFPGFSNHLMTDDFWSTFPGPVFAVLTILVCGFVAVYLLGGKGYCTYGCPYGGFFALTDRFAAGRILVNDDCQQCGHCTAVCTSNVNVSQEVKLYGMVVDPGCMKCLDCVSVCPNNALRFGLTTPSLARPPASAPVPAPNYDFTRAEEAIMMVVFLGATLAYRGLYDGPPLLLSVAAGGITAVLTIKLFHLFRTPTVRIQNLVVKSAGRIRPSGWAFALFASVLFVFTVHSGFVQWHRAWGVYHKDNTEAGDEIFTLTADQLPKYSDRHYRALTATARHFAQADKWGLVPVVEVKLGLAWTSLLQGRDEAAERYVRQAVALAPEKPQLHQHLANTLFKRGKTAEAVTVMRHIMTLRPPIAADHFRLAGLLAAADRTEEAVDAYRACLKLAPDFHDAHFNLGGLLGRTGRSEEAVRCLLEADRLRPDDPDLHIELGLAYAAWGRINEAIRAFQHAAELDPDDPRPKAHLDTIRRNLRRIEQP